MADPTYEDDDAFNAPSPSRQRAPDPGMVTRARSPVVVAPPASRFSDDEAFRAPQSTAAPTPTPTPVYSGSFLPATRYSDGTVGFDSNAGIAGMAKRAAQGAWSGVTLPGDVATGKVDPNSSDAIRRSMDLATLASPDAAVATARKVITPPTALDLKAAGSAGYEAIRNMGVDYSIPHVADRAAQVQQGLNDQGFTSRVAPDVHATLSDLQNAPADGVAVPISLLDNARREFGQIARDYKNKPQQASAKIAQNAIDDFIANPPKGSVLSGPADKAAQTLKEARDNYAAGSRSDTINQRGDYAEYKANDSNAGQNLPNNLRKQASWFLDPMHPERRAGFSSAELAAFDKVNRGTIGTNTARTVGSWLGAGHGVIAGFGMGGAGVEGYHAFGLPGLAIGAVPALAGMGAKALEKKWTQRQFDAADELVRQRSPLYREQAASAPVEMTAAPRNAIAARSAVANIATPDAPVAPDTPTVSPAQKPKRGAPLPPPMTPEEAAKYVQTIQPGQTFAKGGAVKRKNHDELVSRLMDLSEKAKNATKRDTKAILNVPDNTVAKALEVAAKAI